MIYSNIFILALGSLYLIQYGDDGISQIECVCRGSTLVEDNLQLWLGCSQVEHRLAEVLAKLRIQPSRTDNHIIAANSHNFLLTMKFRSSINAKRFIQDRDTFICLRVIEDIIVMLFNSVYKLPSCEPGSKNRFAHCLSRIMLHES